MVRWYNTLQTCIYIRTICLFFQNVFFLHLFFTFQLIFFNFFCTFQLNSYHTWKYRKRLLSSGTLWTSRGHSCLPPPPPLPALLCKLCNENTCGSFVFCRPGRVRTYFSICACNAYVRIQEYWMVLNSAG